MHHPTSRLRSHLGGAAAALALALTAAGCLGGRFKNAGETPAALDGPSQVVLERIAAARQARGRRPLALVPELQPIAARGATAMARGDWSPKTAAQRIAIKGVEEMGRHVWAFVTECADVAAFVPPPMVVDAPNLLVGVVAVRGAAAGRAGPVVVMMAEPGVSALRADQMGGGVGTVPDLNQYAHPVIAGGACGAEWPVGSRVPW